MGDYDGKNLEKWSGDDQEKDVKILNECANIEDEAFSLMQRL